MPKQAREEMMKSASERKLRKRWSFLERLFRSRSGSDTERARQPTAQPGSLNR